MIELRSNELGNADPTTFGSQSGELDLYAGLTSPFSTDAIVLSDEHKRQIEDFVAAAAANYTPEPTLVNSKFGLPTLIARVDCTVDANGNIVPYEMEDSPSGQGITDRILRCIGQSGIRQTILDHYEEQLGTVPTVLISNARNHGTDDLLIVGESNYVGPGNTSKQLAVSGPVIIKAIPGNLESRLPYIALQSQAIAPLETEGDKAYAERIGLLVPVSSPNELLVDADGELCSQVVKARLGSMAMGISIYLNKADRATFGKAGSVSAGRLERDIDRYIADANGALVQEFVPPIQIRNPENRTNAALRVFTLLSSGPAGIEVRAIGGCYVARNEVVIHGASNAVSGAVLV